MGWDGMGCPQSSGSVPKPGCAHCTCLRPKPRRRRRHTAGEQRAWEKLLQQRGKSCRAPGSLDSPPPPPPQARPFHHSSEESCHKCPSPDQPQGHAVLLWPRHPPDLPPGRDLLWHGVVREAGQREAVVAAGKERAAVVRLAEQKPQVPPEPAHSPAPLWAATPEHAVLPGRRPQLQRDPHRV